MALRYNSSYTVVEFKILIQTKRIVKNYNHNLLEQVDKCFSNNTKTTRDGRVQALCLYCEYRKPCVFVSLRARKKQVKITSLLLIDYPTVKL